MFGRNACAWGSGHFDRRRIERFIVAEFLAGVEPRKKEERWKSCHVAHLCQEDEGLKEHCSLKGQVNGRLPGILGTEVLLQGSGHKAKQGEDNDV